jgi:hypothetical protein
MAIWSGWWKHVASPLAWWSRHRAASRGPGSEPSSLERPLPEALWLLRELERARGGRSPAWGATLARALAALLTELDGALARAGVPIAERAEMLVAGEALRISVEACAWDEVRLRAAELDAAVRGLGGPRAVGPA